MRIVHGMSMDVLTSKEQKCYVHSLNKKQHKFNVVLWENSSLVLWTTAFEEKNLFTTLKPGKGTEHNKDIQTINF